MAVSGRKVDHERRVDETIYSIHEKVAYNINYYGRTEAFTSLDSEAVWQIKRVTTDAFGVQRTIYANNGKYNCVWDDRTTYFPAAPAAQPDPTISVSASFSGLQIAGLITVVSINNTTWTALPATALVNRNAMCIFNTGGVEIKLNYDAGVVGYVGVPLAASNQRFYDITDDIVIYAKTSAGTFNITVEELS